MSGKEGRGSRGREERGTDIEKVAGTWKADTDTL